MQTQRPLCLRDHVPRGPYPNWLCARKCSASAHRILSTPYAQLSVLCPDITVKRGGKSVIKVIWETVGACIARLNPDLVLPADMPWFDKTTPTWVACWTSRWPGEFRHLARAQALVRPDVSEQILWTDVDRRAADRLANGPTATEVATLRRLTQRVAWVLLTALREPALVRHIMVACGGTVSAPPELPGLRRNILETHPVSGVRYVRGSLAASPCGVGFSQANTKRELLYLAAHTRASNDQPSLSWTKAKIARHLLRD